jgi:acyl-CoA synthetase (AMP-forming)/AMP-acid ligase II
VSLWEIILTPPGPPRVRVQHVVVDVSSRGVNLMTTSPQLLHEILDVAAARRPGAAAVTAGETTLTYQELADRSRRLAGWLRRRGLVRGQRIVVVGGHGPIVLALVYGASRAGVVFTVLHEQVRGSQLEHILTDCEPHLVVGSSPEALAQARGHGYTTAEADELGAAAAAGPDEMPPPEAPLTVDPVCMIYTSGSTSRPKAVVSTQAQVVFAVQAIQSVLQYQSQDVVYSLLPLSFDYGLYQLFLAGAAGARLWLGDPGDLGRQLVQALDLAGATVLPVVPSLAESLIRTLRRTAWTLPRLRLVTNTGAALPGPTRDALRELLPGLRIHVMFGLTECKRATIMPADGDLDRPDSCGRALPGTEVFVIDGAGCRLPAGEVGEIVVRGPNVMAGYWRSPELCALRFHRADGLFPELRTGDYGRVDEQGYLYFTGRLDDIYKESGFRVSVLEVEAAALQVGGVSGAAVVPPSADEPAVLFVVGDALPKQVRQAMREHLEDFKIPKRCVVIPELPLTANGKVNRKALVALART